MECLDIFGGVIIQGAKATGKSTTAEHHSKSSVRLDSSPALALIANEDPPAVLTGETPRLIDEWQLAPNIWNAVRHEVDRRRSPGQFILTGSATPVDEVTRHSGAGRFGRITLRPLSMAEAGLSTKQILFSSLANGETSEQISGYGGPSISQYAAIIALSGWPGTIGKDELAVSRFLSAYTDDVTRASVPGIEEKVDPVRMRALIRAISRNLATERPVARLAAEANISDTTAWKYLDILGFNAAGFLGKKNSIFSIIEISTYLYPKPLTR